MTNYLNCCCADESFFCSENMSAQRDAAHEQLNLEKRKILFKEFECKIQLPCSYHHKLAVLEGDVEEPVPKHQNTGRYSPEWDMSNFDGLDD